MARGDKTIYMNLDNIRIVEVWQNSWEEELYKYITGIVRNNDQKLLAINGMPDHIHILMNVAIL